MAAEQPESTAPTVSVLMSVYNGGHFLEESVRSILGQTFGDFELLVVDDGSTDGSAKIITRLAGEDSRIIPLRNETNLGLTRSLNLAIAKARGRYLARQDADDVSLPERIARQVEFLDNHPETGVLGTACEIIDEAGKIIGGRDYATDPATLRRELIIKNFALNHSTVMARAELVRRLGGYDESLRYAQDHDLWWRISEQAGLANLDGKLLRWRSSGGQISSGARDEQLKCMLAISLWIVGSLAGGTAIPQESYERFWWAINSDRLREVTAEDISSLVPLWTALSTDGRYPPATLRAIEDTAIRLYRAGNYTAAGVLSRALGTHFGRKPGAFTVLSSVLKGMLSGR